jgi:hypothetical protein
MPSTIYLYIVHVMSFEIFITSAGKFVLMMTSFSVKPDKFHSALSQCVGDLFYYLISVFVYDA